MMKRIDESDLAHVLENTKDIWERVRNKSVFITGGTGFFGKWLLESFIYINDMLRLEASVTVLTRNPDKFRSEFPFYATFKNVSFLKGDVIDFEFPKNKYHFIIHAATESDAKINSENPLGMLNTITNGTGRMLNFAKEQQVESFLLTSSGAVYGKQPFDVTHIKETDSFFIDINHPAAAYTEGKRLAELYCAIYHQQFEIPVKIARCFAFVGPYLPLDKHFAIGNFILNVLEKQDIIIKGNGTPYRSYLYAADLAVWLWTILLKGKNNVAYNVGSDEDYQLKDIAKLVAAHSEEAISVNILQKENNGQPVERYVPSVTKAKSELMLAPILGLREAIKRTISYYKEQSN